MISILSSLGFLVAAGTTTLPLPSVSDVLSGMARQTAGIESYDVPVTIHVSVRKGFLSIPFTLTGKRYFSAPDREALKLAGMPAVAHAFSDIYSSLGTPSTWTQTYDLKVVNPDHSSPQPAYELLATYKRPSSVDHILLDVDATTYDPVEVRWFYRNGATIVMNVQEKSVGNFRLPAAEDINVRFPEYRGHATIEYGAYNVNQAVDTSVFTTKK